MIGALFDAAIRRHQAGALAEAEGLYRQVLATQPDHADALRHLGGLTYQLGRPGEAVPLLERAAALDPHRASIHNNLGLALQALGRFTNAEAAYRRAVALQPNDLGARYNLGNVLQELGRLEEAAAAYGQVLAADPADAEARNNLGAVLQRQGRLPEALAEFRAAIALRPDYADAHDNLLLALNYPSDISAAEIGDAHRRWGALYGPPPPAPPASDPDPARRLRIGYVSGDLKAHSVAFFLEPLLRAHDRAAFEVTCYAEVPRPDGVTERLKDFADRWRSTVGLADDAVAEMIRADGIDILIDLSGHTDANRLPVFARRPAPVAATWLGYANALPCSLAWAAFGEANGAASAQEMRARIARYRRADPADRTDFMIGCRILTQPFFFDEADWIAVPPSWSANIVSFKTYNADHPEGMALWDAVQDRLSRTPASGFADEPARYGAPHLIRPRLGQGAFRVLVTDLYRRRCAVTGERTLPALEAAHIRPYGDGGEHEARNGLLLRRDIHSLFDAGYVTVTPDRRFEVSDRIREEFDNGRHYYALHGQPISVPDAAMQAPDPAALAWHNENCFRG